MPKLFRFLESPEHILAGDEVWSHRGSEWRAVSPDFIDTEYSDWMPPVRRAATTQATVKVDDPDYVWVKCPNGHDAPGQQHFDYCGLCSTCAAVLVECEAPSAAVPQAGATLTVEQIDRIVGIWERYPGTEFADQLRTLLATPTADKQ